MALEELAKPGGYGQAVAHGIGINPGRMWWWPVITQSDDIGRLFTIQRGRPIHGEGNSANSAYTHQTLVRNVPQPDSEISLVIGEIEERTAWLDVNLAGVTLRYADEGLEVLREE